MKRLVVMVVLLLMVTSVTAADDCGFLCQAKKFFVGDEALRGNAAGWFDRQDALVGFATGSCPGWPQTIKSTKSATTPGLTFTCVGVQGGKAVYEAKSQSLDTNMASGGNIESLKIEVDNNFNTNVVEVDANVNKNPFNPSAGSDQVTCQGQQNCNDVIDGFGGLKKVAFDNAKKSAVENLQNSPSYNPNLQQQAPEPAPVSASAEYIDAGNLEFAAIQAAAQGDKKVAVDNYVEAGVKYQEAAEKSGKTEYHNAAAEAFKNAAELSDSNAAKLDLYISASESYHQAGDTDSGNNALYDAALIYESYGDYDLAKNLYQQGGYSNKVAAMEQNLASGPQPGTQPVPVTQTDQELAAAAKQKLGALIEEKYGDQIENVDFNIEYSGNSPVGGSEIVITKKDGTIIKIPYTKDAATSVGKKSFSIDGQTINPAAGYVDSFAGELGAPAVSPYENIDFATYNKQASTQIDYTGAVFIDTNDDGSPDLVSFGSGSYSAAGNLDKTFYESNKDNIELFKGQGSDYVGTGSAERKNYAYQPDVLKAFCQSNLCEGFNYKYGTDDPGLSVTSGGVQYEYDYSKNGFISPTGELITVSTSPSTTGQNNKLSQALSSMSTKSGSYSDNKEYIDGLYEQGVLTAEEYKEINGEGLFNLEENMGYVTNLVQSKIPSSQLGDTMATISAKQKLGALIEEKYGDQIESFQLNIEYNGNIPTGDSEIVITKKDGNQVKIPYDSIDSSLVGKESFEINGKTINPAAGYVDGFADTGQLNAPTNLGVSPPTITQPAAQQLEPLNNIEEVKRGAVAITPQGNMVVMVPRYDEQGKFIKDEFYNMDPESGELTEKLELDILDLISIDAEASKIGGIVNGHYQATDEEVFENDVITQIKTLKIASLAKIESDLESKEGDYSDNKDYIDQLHEAGILTDEEYEEINGKGLFNLEEDIGYVAKLLQQKQSKLEQEKQEITIQPQTATETAATPLDVSQANVISSGSGSFAHQLTEGGTTTTTKTAGSHTMISVGDKTLVKLEGDGKIEEGDIFIDYSDASKRYKVVGGQLIPTEETAQPVAAPVSAGQPADQPAPEVPTPVAVPESAVAAESVVLTPEVITPSLPQKVQVGIHEYDVSQSGDLTTYKEGETEIVIDNSGKPVSFSTDGGETFKDYSSNLNNHPQAKALVVKNIEDSAELVRNNIGQIQKLRTEGKIAEANALLASTQQKKDAMDKQIKAAKEGNVGNVPEVIEAEEEFYLFKDILGDEASTLSSLGTAAEPVSAPQPGAGAQPVAQPTAEEQAAEVQTKAAAETAFAEATEIGQHISNFYPNAKSKNEIKQTNGVHVVTLDNGRTIIKDTKVPGSQPIEIPTKVYEDLTKGTDAGITIDGDVIRAGDGRKMQTTTQNVGGVPRTSYFTDVPGEAVEGKPDKKRIVRNEQGEFLYEQSQLKDVDKDGNKYITDASGKKFKVEEGFVGGYCTGEKKTCLTGTDGSLAGRSVIPPGENFLDTGYAADLISDKAKDGTLTETMKYQTKGPDGELVDNEYKRFCNNGECTESNFEGDVYTYDGRPQFRTTAEGIREYNSGLMGAFTFVDSGVGLSGCYETKYCSENVFFSPDGDYACKTPNCNEKNAIADTSDEGWENSFCSTDDACRETVKTAKRDQEIGLFFAGRQEWQQWSGAILDVGSGWHSLSNALFGDVYANELATSIDKWFTSSILGEEYWESKVCYEKHGDVQEDGFAFIETPYGTFQAVASIQAEMVKERTPLLCMVNLETDEMSCPRGLYCNAEDNFCYEDEYSEEPVTGFFYKITWGVTAPFDESLTPYGDEDAAVSFNVYIGIKPLYSSIIELSNGQSEKDVYTHYSDTDYEGSDVCIRWFNAPETANRDTAFGGTNKVGDVCFAIQESVQGVVNYDFRTGGSTSTLSSGEVTRNTQW